MFLIACWSLIKFFEIICFNFKKLHTGNDFASLSPVSELVEIFYAADPQN